MPHNLISDQESPVPLLNFQMAPRLKFLMSSGFKKGTQIYYPFLSKSPGKRILSRFPNVAPMVRDTHLQGIFTSVLIYLFNISFGVPSKDALPLGPPHGVSSERVAPFLELSFIHHSKSPVYEPPLLIPGFPQTKRCPYGERCPYLEPFSTYLPGSPVKEPSPEALRTEPLQREILHS